VFPDGAPAGTCTAPTPAGGGGGHADIHTPGWDVAYGWTLPSTIADGATATLNVNVTSKSGGSILEGMTLKPPSEFGLQTPPFHAEANAAPMGSAVGAGSFTFHPNRAFTVGEVLYIRVELGDCVAFVYEYVAR
jgi:hypothetical protein